MAALAIHPGEVTEGERGGFRGYLLVRGRGRNCAAAVNRAADDASDAVQCYWPLNRAAGGKAASFASNSARRSPEFTGFLPQRLDVLIRSSGLRR